MGAVFLSAIGLALTGLPVAAMAHVARAPEGRDVEAWSVLLVVLLCASALLYALGVGRLWRKAGARRGVRTAHACSFAFAWLVLAGALLSPIDALADRSFALHMLQHELLMLVAAPLFVLARPVEALTWALTPRVRRLAATAWHVHRLNHAWRALAGQWGAWCVHAAALWIWHVPVLFMAAVENPSLHVLQHACFLGSALLFWWSVLRHRAGVHSASAMAAVFTTMLHTSALGALLTLAPHALYLIDAGAPLLGLSALEDQQLGGLLMWVPGSVVYVAAALAIAATWLSPVRAHHDVA